MMEKSHVLIVGAGIAGLWTAFHLNRAGYRVSIVEKNSGDDNCSYGNAGMIVPSHVIPLSSPGIIRKGLRWMFDPTSPFYIHPSLNRDLLRWLWAFRKASTDEHVQAAGPVLRDLLLLSKQLLLDLEKEEKLDFDFRKKGLFMFCNTPSGLENEIAAAEQAIGLGLTADILSPEEVMDMDAALDLNIVGAVYYPQDAHLNPRKLMDSLKYLLSQSGVDFHYNTEIDKLETEGNVVTRAASSDGRMWSFGQLVICSGIWSSGMAKSIGNRLPMQAGKGYCITVENPGLLPDHCGILAEKKVTMTPVNGALRFGGTMEIVGLDTSINPKKITGLKNAVSAYLPRFEVNKLEGLKVWTGLRPIAPDTLPYAGKLNGFNNLYVSTGHAMMGMSLAPACGKLISDLIKDGKSVMDSALIDPNRYNK